MKQCYRNNQINGNVLVAENGKVIYQKSFGIANFDTKEPLTIYHQFRIGSVTKQFTAMAIMILIERNKLNYNDDIQKYLPELPYKGITINHLLTHTSGIPAHEDLFYQYWDANKNDAEKKVADNNDILAMLIKHKPDVLFKPGEKWDYSNTGYNLLALIVSRLSGEPFEEFMKNNIFEPLGMSQTLVYSPIWDDRMEHRVYGFRLALNGMDHIPNDYHYLNGAAGDGGIYSTIGDIFKWDRALYTEKLISKKTLEKAFTPVILNDSSTHNYGFGWQIDSTKNDKKIVSHGGSWVGFRAMISRIIDDDITIILMFNDSSPYSRPILRAIRNILYKRSFNYPKIKISQIIGKTLMTQGIDKAITQYHNLKTSKPNMYYFMETELNSLGYRLIGLEKLSDAIEIFKLNVESFPDSPNTYDSLGEAYMLIGNSKLAIENYKKSLELEPDNTNAVEKLNELMRK